MTPEDLIAANFRPFFDKFKSESMGDWYQKSYQKRVIDETGTRFFITVAHSYVPTNFDYPGNRNLYTAENQFSRGDRTFTVSLGVGNESPADVEQFFEEAFTAMKADYYSKNYEE